MKIYIDTCCLIYYIEKVNGKYLTVASFAEKTENQIYTCEIGRLECRIKPIRDNNPELLKDYDIFFNEGDTIIMPITREIIDHATEIRANFKFKTPDALHIAAAELANFDIFLTNDLDISKKYISKNIMKIQLV
jgi:predicted nucleic acid-binding protein